MKLKKNIEGAPVNKYLIKGKKGHLPNFCIFVVLKRFKLNNY